MTPSTPGAQTGFAQGTPPLRREACLADLLGPEVADGGLGSYTAPSRCPTEQDRPVTPVTPRGGSNHTRNSGKAGSTQLGGPWATLSFDFLAPKAGLLRRILEGWSLEPGTASAQWVAPPCSHLPCPRLPAHHSLPCSLDTSE